MRKLPFRHNPRLAARHARLCRLIAKGIIDDEPTKQVQRQAAQDAIAASPITIIPTGKRTRSEPHMG